MKMTSSSRKTGKVIFAIFVIVIITCHSLDDFLLKDKQTKEFCQADELHITCSGWKGHVIIVLSARYGRMKMGRCVKGNYGDIGCTMNALFYLDQHCSGEVECRFVVFDALELRERSPCPEDVASYIEVTYACIEATNPDKKQCMSRKYVTTSITSHYDTSNPKTPPNLPTSTHPPTGIITSTAASRHLIGSGDCPWLITTWKGLQLSFKLRYVSPEYRDQLDKYRKIKGDKQLPPNHQRAQVAYPINQVCLELATLEDVGYSGDPDGQMDARSMERGSKRIVTTCDAGNILEGSEKEIYVSRMSGVMMTIVGKQQLKTLGKFFISYQAIGCPDMIPPFNATITRDVHVTTVKCNHSEHTWQLTCKNGTWIGDSINCNQGTTSAWGLANIFDRHNFPFGILIVVSSGVALGIFLGGLLLVCVVVYMKRQQELNQKFHCVTDESRMEHHQMITTPDVLDTSYPEQGDGSQICPSQGAKRPIGYASDEAGTKLQTLQSKQQACLTNYNEAYPTCHGTIGQTDYPAPRSLVACQDYDRSSSTKSSIHFQGCQGNVGMAHNFGPLCPKGVQFCGGVTSGKATGVHLYELPRVI